MAEDDKKGLDLVGGLRRQQRDGDINNVFIGTVTSGISSLGEMFGADPISGVPKFRAEHPGLALGADLLIPGGAYVKAYKALRNVDRLEKIRDRVGDVNKFPISTRAAQEVVTVAPIEFARIASSAIVQDGENFTDTLASAGFNLAATFGIGAAFGGIGAYGRRVGERQRPISGVDLNQPRQLQMRELFRNLANATDDAQKGALQRSINQLQTDIRLETPTKTNKLIRELEGLDKDGLREVRRTLNKARGKEVSLLSNSLAGGLGSDAALQGAMRAARLRTQDFAYMQFPRVIKFNEVKPRKITEKVLQRRLDGPLDGMYIGKERDGLFTMFRPMDDGRMLFFKTDQPVRFLSTNRQGYINKIANPLGFNREPPFVASASQAEKVLALQSIRRFKETFPLREFRGIEDATGNVLAGKNWLAKRLGLQTPEEIKVLGDRLGSMFNRYFAPTMFKVARNPRARYLWGMSRASKDSVDAWVQRTLRGSIDIEDNLFDFVRGNVQANDDRALFGIIDSLADDEIAQVWRAVDDMWSIEQTAQRLAQGEVSEGAASVVGLLRELDSRVVQQLKTIGEIRPGRLEFTPLENHLAVARTWRGSYRIPINNEKGKLVHVASGYTRKEAVDEANHVVQGVRTEGKNWKIGDEFNDHSINDDVMLASRLNPEGQQSTNALAWARDYLRQRAIQPGTFRERSGVGGYIREGKEELKKVIEDHLRRNMNFVTRESVYAEANADLRRLFQEDKNLGAGLVESIDALFGTPGKLSKLTNELVDKVVSPVLGKDSASKIVAAANSFMMNFQLGAGNLQFPLLNALTYMQTTLPQIAFVMGSAPADLAKYYSYIPAVSNRSVKGSIGFVDSMKLGYEVMRDMRKAPPDLLQAFKQAAREGVVDPRLVEEYVGANSLSVKKLKESFSENYVEGMRSISEFLPGVSEKFARTHTFTVGHKLAKEFLRIDDPKRIYQFAKEFTNNTMFLYSAADRARVITGPIGSLFGMFKNWQMHYMGWMAEYAGQGIMKGNWAPLLWQTAGTGIVGGIGGLPLVGLAEAYSEWATGKGVLEHTYDFFGADDSGFGNMADGVFFGLPAFLGISLQDSSAAPLADPARDASMLMSFVHLDRARALGRAVGDAYDVYNATGRHPIQDKNTLDQFSRALAPRSVYRAMSVTEGNYLRSMRNSNPQIRGLSGTERLLVAAGFTPSFVGRSYEFAAEAWADQQKYRERVSTFGRLWQEAQEGRDYDALQNLYWQMTAQGIDFNRVMRSAAAHGRREEQDILDKTPDILQGRQEFLRR